MFLKPECDFTLALNNRTGKYYFCKELIEASHDLIKKVHSWRISGNETPNGLMARILGRLARIEIALRFEHPSSYRLFPPMARQAPMIFTDPRECLLYKIKPNDVVVCHDLGPLTHAELYHPGTHKLYKAAFARIAAARPLMLFVSDTSRRAFAELYGRDFPLMDVIPIPPRAGISDDDVVPYRGAPKRFLLTVGSIGARKNQLRSIEAFARSGLAEEGYGYVLCGAQEPGYDAVLSAANQASGVILTGYVSDAELRWLYRNACGFVLPSLLEGFGLPAAEAVIHGLVPLIGAGGALHEVAGDSAILVDPTRVDEIARGMRLLVEMSEEKKESQLVELRKQVALFSKARTVAVWRSALERAMELSGDRVAEPRA